MKNRLTGTGFIAKVETKQDKNGKNFCLLAVATSDSYKNEKGEYVDNTTFLTFNAFFEKQVDYIINNVKKGDFCTLIGSVKQYKKIVDNETIYKNIFHLDKIIKHISASKILKEKK